MADREQHGGRGDIVVMVVVLADLKVPEKLARVGVEIEHGIGVQVVAHADLRIQGRRRIRDGDEEFACLRIEGICRPGGAAAGLPCGSGPSSTAAVRMLDRVERPEHLTGIGIERQHAPRHAKIAARRAHQHLPVPRERCRGQVLAGRGIADPGTPQLATGGGVVREHPVVPVPRNSLPFQYATPRLAL